MMIIRAGVLLCLGGMLEAGAESLRWNPLTSSNWNFTQTNWFNTVAPANTTFTNGDGVLFNDAGAASNRVNLVGTLLPASIVVQSSSNYTLRGTGQLSGATGLLKVGPGSLTLRCVGVGPQVSLEHQAVTSAISRLFRS